MLSRNHIKIFIAALVLLTLVFATFGKAYALRIIPQRLVLKPEVKVEYMFVKNNGDKTESFRLGWKHLAMDKEGNILNLDKIGMDKAPPGYKPADDIIRFSPRRTTLKPGQTQRIIFMVNRSKALEAGEYRSHFLFEREPDKKTVETPLDENNNPVPEINPPQEDSKPIVAFDVLVSRAVPVYVLNGETNAKLNFVNAKIEKNLQKNQKSQPDYVANFKVQKEGNRSVIGIAQILCTSGGEEVVISKPSKVFAVYAEGEFREETMAVQLPAKGCSSYRLVVKGHPDDVLAGQTLIDQSFSK
ncbi:MAG TPA: hypothetical protein PLF01_05875 [Alphaproteobacteria bacterium]|nr:hypothetical protein [Alphaproteobacteria bacterium]